MYASIFYLAWKYQSDSSLMSAVVASFSGKHIDVNSSVKSFHDAKHIFPEHSSCREILSAKLATHAPLKYDSAQWMHTCSSTKSDVVSKNVQLTGREEGAPLRSISIKVTGDAQFNSGGLRRLQRGDYKWSGD
jgi:hypothetical protein